jgi:hypothetical protein
MTAKTHKDETVIFHYSDTNSTHSILFSENTKRICYLPMSGFSFHTNETQTRSLMTTVISDAVTMLATHIHSSLQCIRHRNIPMHDQGYTI